MTSQVQINEKLFSDEIHQRQVMLESLLRRYDEFYISFPGGTLKDIYGNHPLIAPNSSSRTFPFITIKQPCSFNERFDGKTYSFNRVSTGNSRKLTSSQALVTLATSMDANVLRLHSQLRDHRRFFYGAFVPSGNRPSKQDMQFIARTLIDHYSLK